MPLTVRYRPVMLPPEAVPAPRAIIGAPEPGDLRPRDFTARIRQRDMISARRALRRPSLLRQRVAGIAAIGLAGAVLGMLGWGNPQGIEPAAAQERLQPFERSGESFPGSAFYYLAPGDSGLVAPDAAQAAWNARRDDEDMTSPAGPAARPVLARGSGEDQWRALQCLTAAVYYEAASEPDAGQRAVAQVVLNRVAHPAYPNSVCGVVYQGSERPGCQFSFACDGSLARRPVAAFWDRARRVAADALAGYVYAPVGLATHYHTWAVHPGWADKLTFIGAIGAHRFYRWAGSAGRPAAFTSVYAGGEPMAAPHPRSWTPTPADVADPVALEQAFEEGRIAALRQAGAVAPGASFGQAPLPHASAPTYVPAVEERGGDAVFKAGALPRSGAVNPAYENAGKWIAQPQG
ncbi:cell wall hydrolase [Novosphingobium sp. KCTC 2891]|uniref:cell wall hydrolase n=1 Tax=Novosphingobium sp. KCTC 2891 TaxID=2989730 RepID=UPI0022224E68|nr:cell wall hydrolase [Novosphingobium sp. KCTC 2891]MCW1381569.1 cell wall hydrolase [Novosphingobium sp. KCTC 2891]